jgi:hypothetical protein
MEINIFVIYNIEWMKMKQRMKIKQTIKKRNI